MLARSNSSFHPRIPELQVGAVRPPSKMLRVLLLPALATALQLSTFAPVSTVRAARATGVDAVQLVKMSGNPYALYGVDIIGLSPSHLHAARVAAHLAAAADTAKSLSAVTVKFRWVTPS